MKAILVGDLSPSVTSSTSKSLSLRIGAGVILLDASDCSDNIALWCGNNCCVENGSCCCCFALLIAVVRKTRSQTLIRIIKKQIILCCFETTSRLVDGPAKKGLWIV